MVVALLGWGGAAGARERAGWQQPGGSTSERASSLRGGGSGPQAAVPACALLAGWLAGWLTMSKQSALAGSPRCCTLQRGTGELLLPGCLQQAARSLQPAAS